MLTAIARAIVADAADLDRKLSELRGCGRILRNPAPITERQVLEYSRRMVLWQRQDLEAWAGRALTDSERIRWQQSVRQLEQAGLIERDGRHVKLTAAGWQAVGLEEPK